MSSHPNRSKRRTDDPARTPQPDEIREARERAGLTPRQAGALVYVTGSKWEACEAGTARMHPGLWELFAIKLRWQRDTAAAKRYQLKLHKYTDPTEDARDGLTIAEAEAVASEDPSLIYVETID
jgi:putative transcriptional regulator